MLLIAIGGAGGAICRHGLVNLIHQLSGSKFPYGTLCVNVIGSFLIGVMYVIITERLSLHPDWRNIVMVGFLGAFTTFSTFSLDAIILFEHGQVATALAYIASSVLVCLFFVWAAISLTRLL